MSALPDFGEADVKLINGANMVHALGLDRTFHDYVENKVIVWHLIIARYVDVIWDQYLSDSLTTKTRVSMTVFTE